VDYGFALPNDHDPRHRGVYVSAHLSAPGSSWGGAVQPTGSYVAGEAVGCAEDLSFLVCLEQGARVVWRAVLESCQFLDSEYRHFLYARYGAQYGDEDVLTKILTQEDLFVILTEDGFAASDSPFVVRVFAINARTARVALLLSRDEPNILDCISSQGEADIAALFVFKSQQSQTVRVARENHHHDYEAALSLLLLSSHPVGTKKPWSRVAGSVDEVMLSIEEPPKESHDCGVENCDLGWARGEDEGLMPELLAKVLLESFLLSNASIKWL
jgi:hypothetical protein